MLAQAVGFLTQKILLSQNMRERAKASSDILQRQAQHLPNTKLGTRKTAVTKTPLQ